MEGGNCTLRMQVGVRESEQEKRGRSGSVGGPDGPPAFRCTHVLLLSLFSLKLSPGARGEGDEGEEAATVWADPPVSSACFPPGCTGQVRHGNVLHTLPQPRAARGVEHRRAAGGGTSVVCPFRVEGLRDMSPEEL